jgi:pyridoxamine-phosphate oxidase
MRRQTTALQADTLSGDAPAQAPEFDDPPDDALALLRDWIDRALVGEVREPLVLGLATCDAAGRPSSRTVLLKALDERGLVFTSHYRSRKGRDLEAVPYAAATLYWREISRQVNVSGRVERLTAQESDALFTERSRAAQATTVVSEQSAALGDEGSLRARADGLLREDAAIKRPADWGGYRLVIEQAEFWQGSPDRLHLRLLYTRDDDRWSAVRLQP